MRIMSRYLGLFDLARIVCFGDIVALATSFG